MKHFVVNVLALSLFANCCFAADLTDCGSNSDEAATALGKVIEKSVYVPLANEFRPVSTLLVSANNKHKGKVVQYLKGDAILVAEVEQNIEKTFFAIKPGLDITRKALFGTSYYSYNAGELTQLTRQIKLNDESDFTVIGTKVRTGSGSGNEYLHWLLVRKDGRVCNDMLVTNLKFQGSFWTGKVTGSVDTVEISKEISKKRTKLDGLRLIYNGTEAGQISIQEVWVSPKGEVKSQAKKFDQFAKTIDIAGLSFQLLEASADKISLKYDFEDSFQ